MMSGGKGGKFQDAGDVITRPRPGSGKGSDGFHLAALDQLGSDEGTFQYLDKRWLGGPRGMGDHTTRIMRTEHPHRSIL